MTNLCREDSFCYPLDLTRYNILYQKRKIQNQENSYEDFLEERRKLMTGKIKAAFELLKKNVI